MRLISGACAVKGIATILTLIAPGLHDYLITCSAFSVPFTLAVLFDDTIANRFGFLIIAFHVAYLVIWCVSQILLRRESVNCVVVGLYCVIGVNLCDITCAVISCLDLFSISKVTNILISLTVLVLSLYALSNKTGGQGGQGQGDGSVVPSGKEE